MLSLGTDVVLDWNQWNPQRRAESRDRARAAGFPARLHFLDVPLEVAVQRARERATTGELNAHQIDEEGVRHFATIFVAPAAGEGLAIERYDNS